MKPNGSDFFIEFIPPVFRIRISFRFLISALVFVFIFPVSGSAFEYDLKTTLTTENSSAFESNSGEQEQFASSVQVKPDLYLTLSDRWYAALAPRFRLGLSDPEYHLVSPDDLYLEFVEDRFELRVGYQTFFWGTVESVNVVDILNQEDYKGDFLDPDKLGEPAVRYRFLIGENRFDLYYLAYFTVAPMPDRVNRFNFFDGTRNMSEDPLYSSPSERLRPQVALRWERTLGSADVGLSYFNGYEKFPVVSISPIQEDAEVFYYEMQQAGADLQMSLGEWLIKGEAIYQDTNMAGSFNRLSLLPDGSVVLRDLVPRDHAAFVGGFEYTFLGWIRRWDLGVIGEYLVDSEQRSGAVAYRPFQNDLFLGFRVTFNNPGDGEILGGLILDINERSQVWRLEYSERYFERVVLMSSIDLINAPLADPISVFNDDDRFSLELSYTF